MRHAHAALPRLWMEPLHPRVLWSAAPASLNAGVIDGAGTGAAAWDVALIDRTLPDQAILRRALEPGGHVILYDGRRDSAADVLLRAARWAESSGATIGSLSLLSHASAGRFELGNEWVSNATLPETAEAWARLGAVMSRSDGAGGASDAGGASINLFGCNLIDPLGGGQQLIDHISQLTGARVFASNDITGRDGDWVLEAASRGASATGATGATGAAHNPFSRARLALWDHDLAVAFGAETRVNTTTSNNQVLNAETQRAVAMDANGNYVVVWTGTNALTADGIYAQRYNAAGVAQGGEFIVNSTFANNQRIASVGMDAAGNFVVVWQSQNQDASTGFGIYGQRFNAAGTKLGGEFRVNSTTANDQKDATVAISSTGSFIVVWTSDKQDGNKGGIYGQRYNAAGVAQGSEFRVNTTTGNDQKRASVAIDSGGKFVVAWSSASQDGGGQGIYAQRFNAAGAKLGGEFRVNTRTAGDQSEPTMAMSSAGNFAIAWTSANQDGDKNGIYAQTYSASGVAQGGEFRVNVTTHDDQKDASAAADGAGNFVFTWTSQNQDGAGGGVYARRFNSAGTALSGEFRANTTTATEQKNSSVGMDPLGDFVVAWSGNGPGDTAGVFAQHYLEAAVKVTPTSGLITNEAGGSATFSVVLNSPPTANVLIGLSSSDTTEGTVAPSITFTSANWNVPQTVTVNGVNDALVDGDVLYSIVTAPATSADASYNGLNAADVSVLNVDDDTTGITVYPTSGHQTTEAGGTATFSVVLHSKPNGNVTVPISSSDTTEGTASVASLTFTAGNWSTPQVVTVTGVDDFVDDGDIAYSIVTGVAVSTDPVYSGFNAADVSVTNLDDDTAGITVTPTGDRVTSEAGASDSFTIVLDSQPLGDVTMPISSSDPASGVTSVASLIFTPANWNVPQTVVLHGVDDTAYDGDTAYTIVTGATTSTDPLYNGTDAAHVAVTNLDDDWEAAPRGGEFRANTTTADIQYTPSTQSVAMDAAGNFVVVWASNLQDGFGYGIYAQRYNALGVAQGGEFRVNTLTVGDQTLPTVAMDDTGDFVIAWSGNGAGDADGIFAQRYNAAGVAQGVNVKVNTTILNAQAAPSVAMSGAGAFVITWESSGTDGSGYGIYAQRYSAAGATQGAEFRVNATTAGDQRAPRVAMDDAGNIVFAWQSNGTDGGGWGVYGRRYKSDGSTQGAEFLVNTTTAGDQLAPAVARDKAGNFVIAWSGSSAADATGGIFAQRYNAAGAAQGGEFLVNTTTADVQSAPAVGMDDAGRFVIAWQSNNQDGSGTGIYGQRYDAAGNEQGQEFRANTATAGAQFSPKLAMDAGGDFVIAWSGAGAGDADGTFAQLYDGSLGGVIVSPVVGLDTGEDGTTDTFTVVLGSKPTANVVIGLSSSNSAEAILSVASLTFTSANWNVPQTVTVTGVNDLVADGDVAYTIITAPATSTDANYNGLDAFDISGINADDDSAGLTVTPTSGLVTTESGGTAQFTVALTSKPLANVTVTLSSSDTTEGTVSGPLTFTPANWSTPQSVTVTGVIDGVVDGDVAYTISSVTSSSDAAYSGLSGDDVSVTNTDVITPVLTSIVVSPGSATVNLNQQQAFTAIAYDQFGNAMSPQPAFTWSVTSGGGAIDSAGHYTAPGAAGGATIAATSGSVNGSATITVNDAAPTVAVAASASPSPVTGLTTNLSALGADDGGESNLTYTWSTTGTPPAPVSFSINGINGAKNSTATFAKAGTYSFLVAITDGGGHTTTSAVSVTVNQTLSRIDVTPGTATLPLNATQQFTAVGSDQFGFVMASPPAFAWSMLSGAGSINASTGVYTAPGVDGTASVAAVSGAVTGTATINVMHAPPTVATPASATPSTVTGTTTNLSVLGADDGGEANLTYTWVTTGAAPATVSFSDNGANSAKNAVATFTKAGNYTFQVTIFDGMESVTSSVSVTVNQATTSLAVSPSSLALNEGSTQQFTAVAFDQFGQAMTSQPAFTWTLASGIGSVDSAGLYTAPAAGGGATVRASAGALHADATVTIDNTVPTVATPASATPNPATGTTTDLSVLGDDDNGEAVLTYTWATTGTPPAPVSFSINGSNASKNTTATFSKAGTYQFVVTIDEAGGGSTSSSVTVTVNQTLTVIAVSPSTATMNLNQQQPFTAAGFDQFGDAMGVQPAFAWSVSSGGGSVNSSGRYTAGGSAGSATVTASSGGVSGSAAVTINDTAPTLARPAVASPNPATNTTTSLSVLGADDGGEGNLTYTWSTTGSPPATVTFSAIATNAAKDVTATFAKAGTYSFLVTISDGTSSVTSTVDVTVVQTLTTIAVSPASAALNLNQQQSFAATGYDQFGDALATQPPLTWSVASGGGGAISSAGVYTAPASAQTATVRAASGSVSGSALVTVTNAAPTVATPASATPGSVNGKTTTLSALGADDGGESNLTYTWTTLGTPPAAVIFSANDTNAAKNATATFGKAGTYDFRVTISDGTLSVTSDVSVTVAQTLTTIAVAPASVTMGENDQQPFAATAFDQFGDAMSPQPITWSVVTGGGSIDAAGLYSSPATPDNVTVRATSGAVHGDATVTVLGAVPIIVTPADATPNPVTGTTAALSVLANDDGGESNLTYTWSSTGTPPAPVTFSINGSNAAKNSTVSFARAGVYTFQVTISDGVNTTTSSVAVTVAQTASTVVVMPASPRVHESAQRQLGAIVYDQFGDALATQPMFAWSIVSGAGRVGSDGAFTAAHAAGRTTIRASIPGGLSGLANVTIVNSAPTILSAASASPSPVTAKTTRLSALSADDGGESLLTYTWDLIGSAPAAVTLSANGTNAAKDVTATFAKAGTYQFRVTISDGAKSATSTVTVVVEQTATSLSITPANTVVVLGQQRAFAATVSDQFGDPLAAQPAITWSIADGAGAVDAATGVYTAPPAEGSATIAASTGSLRATATIAIQRAAPPPPSSTTTTDGGDHHTSEHDPVPEIDPGNGTPTDPSTHTPHDDGHHQSDGDHTHGSSGETDGGSDGSPDGEEPDTPTPSSTTPEGAHGDGTGGTPTADRGGDRTPTPVAPQPAPPVAPPVAITPAPQPAPHVAIAPPARTETSSQVTWQPPPALGEQLNRLQREIVDGGRPSPVIVGTARAAVAVSLGYVLYAFRAGSLLAGLLASIPIWRTLDPLPLLEASRAKVLLGKTRRRKNKDDADDHKPGGESEGSLDSLID